MKKLSWSAAIALLTAAVCVSPASAQVAKCQRTIAKANSQFVQARVKALSKCEEGVVKSGVGTCPDAKAQASLDKAESKMVAAIGKSCGGSDKVCGGIIDDGEFNRDDLGWPKECPPFEKNGCNNTIGEFSCEGIAECLSCIGVAATDQAMDLYYDELVLPSGNDKPLNKCQISIGKASSAFFNSKNKALQKCQDARLNSKHNLDCFPPSVGDGKYAAAIAKAETKKISTICKACGGADKVCGGGDDLTAAAIGFGATCPPVTVPHGGTVCGGPITDLNSIVACVDCVTEFKADCLDALAVPQTAAYPAECNACTAPAPTGACPTSFEFTADGARTDLDAGVSGLGHNAGVPSNGRLTLAISCAGVNEPTCGVCNINGPLTNAGGVTFDNHRCADKPWVQCSIDNDCITGGAAGPCIFFFGAPLPLVAGGVPTCILNQINGPVAGTVNLSDGTSIANVPLISKVHPVGTVFEPCPICEAGQCTAGDNDNGACTVNGTGVFGDVSLDCPPASGTLAGSLQINLNIATGTQTVTVSSANPTCRETGFNSFKCLCDTCNNINQEACMTNAECPISGGNPGICGGRRCIGGTNDGAPCALNSECPAGLCNRPGEATKPNACQDDTTTAGLDCVDVGDDEGECSNGPFEKSCSIQTSKSCNVSEDCICPECLPNQTCIARTRPCFTDNGVIGNSIDVVGKPDAPCAGISRPTVGTFFCVAPVAQGAVNAASGLPGLGRVRIPGLAVIIP